MKDELNLNFKYKSHFFFSIKSNNFPTSESYSEVNSNSFNFSSILSTFNKSK
jgi:hypothetical protein